MLKFRGHHLICLHFFKGEGYSREFIENLKNLVERAEKGEEIEVVAGADDVCRLCPYLTGDRCMHKDDADAEIKKLDNMAINYLGVSIGGKVKWGEIKNKVNFASKKILFCFLRWLRLGKGLYQILIITGAGSRIMRAGVLFPCFL